MNKNYLLKVMRITLFLLLTGICAVSAKSYSQQITFKGRNVSLEVVIQAIRQQTGYSIFSTKHTLSSTVPLTIDVKNMELDQFLSIVTRNQPVTYQVEDRTISFYNLEKNSSKIQSATISTQQQRITGRVIHAESGERMERVTVQIKGTNRVTTTDSKGQFQLLATSIQDENLIILFRYLGMKPKEVVYSGQKFLEVKLEPAAATEIKDVVVTGIYQRNKESFTGSSSTYTAKELKMVGNQNVLQSLKTLDPSFAIVDNNQFGSDPNRLPDIEIRGKSSVIGIADEYSSNPNQPLFILDGFESTLAVIADLSMDRVESITLLKDAAASAIYGSKAANGVVVVETKRPTPGQLRINYTLNGSVSFADLTDYNLMNAEEKLQFELLSGFYGMLDDKGQIILGANPVSEANYLERLREVRRGVNTYWANEPLRTAVNQRHTLFAEGGDQSLRYSVSVNHGIVNGVMKASERKTTNGNIRLLYRKGDLSFTNSLSIDHVVANKEVSPFSTFSRANPYHRKYDENGNIKMVVEDFSASRSGYDPIYSPFYDLNNLNINTQGSEGFTNNFEIEWRMLPELRARGRFGLRSLNLHDEIFRSPFNVEFVGTDQLQKGSYQENNGKNVNYDGDFSLTYGKLFAEKHMLNSVLGARMEQATNKRSSYQVRGFIDDEFSNPNFALGYPEGQRADYTQSKRRGASFFMNMGYSYDKRYLLDATLRSDGSSVFGSERQFSTIWSLGLAWNAHNESFFKQFHWIDQLRLRATIGNPGNQNFDDYISMRVYRYNNDNRNPFGASTIISNMGNSGLRWQTTLDRNLGLDLTIFKSRLRLNLDYFVKSTDPLLVLVSLPTSTGVNTVAKNMGAQVTHGFTIAGDYTLLRREQFNWRVNLNMRQLKAQYQNIGNQLNNFNEANKSRNLIRYYDGGSPSDLWAVRSLGIDPATGREIFLNKNDQQTFVHDYKDEVVVGNSDPDLEGILGTSFYYKGFSASVNLRYRWGGQSFMQTLFEKVENISARDVALNQDKRALYDRWKQPGDEAKFKAISNTDQTPISSRFVADNNMLVGEAFSVGYETTTAGWLRSIRASSVTFRAYMNDIFHLSTITNERGIDYPFARSVSFSAGVRF